MITSEQTSLNTQIGQASLQIVSFDSMIQQNIKQIPHSSCSSKIRRLAMPQFGPTLLILLYFSSLATSCTEQERNSLLQFITGLSYDGGLSSSWKNSTDCCKWEGIICSSDMVVTDVLLSSRRLQGHISASFGNLTGLLRLNLSHNFLSGSLPLEFVFSKSIIVLDVSFNQFNGNLQELHSSVLVQSLQVLNISSNMFTGQFPSTTWEVMKSMIALNASNNRFTGQIPLTFCVSEPSIALLELSCNRFSGSIPPELGNCSMLTSLSAGHNNLSGALPDELFNINSLEHLSLHDNQLEGSLSGISKLTDLVTLDLGENRLRGNIPDTIGKLKRLEVLRLDHNCLSGELPSTLSNCTNLITIDLRSNNFNGELTKVNFSNLPSLKYLDLFVNNFNGTIPESIYSCTKLTALRLASNKFHGQLSERFGNLKSLSFLSLFNNSLTNITSTLHVLRSCENLTTLLIGKNFMHENMPEDDRIHGFENLRLLIINDCSLSGKMPLWLSKLTNLELLALHNNQLSGPIPGWISTLKFLFHLNLSNNSFSGEIPTAITKMPMLITDKIAPNAFELPVYATDAHQYHMLRGFQKVLDLSMNNFTGVIPKEIGQLKELILLNLTSNKLTGAIPQSICRLTNLEELDLSCNHLTGAIPSELSNLHFLSQFNVSNNDLEGSIPTGGQLGTFPSSSFDGNPKLCGPMLAHQCGSAEEKFSLEQTDKNVERVIFVIAFSAFFAVSVLYDQIVLSRYFLRSRSAI